MIIFPAFADGCVTEALDLRKVQVVQLGPQGRLDPISFLVCDTFNFMIQSKAKKSKKMRQQASMLHLCPYLKPLCQLPFINHSAKQSLIRVPNQLGLGTSYPYAAEVASIILSY